MEKKTTLLVVSFLVGIQFVAASTAFLEFSGKLVPDPVEVDKKFPAKVSTGRSKTLFTSDVSGEILQPGKWYHRRGYNQDITIDEWKLLPSASERAQWELIGNSKDIQRAVADRDRGIPLPASSQSATTPQLMTFSKSTTEEQTSSTPYTTAHMAYRSDLSGKPLFLGKWYHKKDSISSFDITQEEYRALAPQEQAKYILVSTTADADRITKNEDTVQATNCPTVVISPGVYCIDTPQGVVKQQFISDLSGKPLTVGSWYHKQGDDTDITKEEFDALPSESQSQFTSINTFYDLKQLVLNSGQPVGNLISSRSSSGSSNNQNLKTNLAFIPKLKNSPTTSMFYSNISQTPLVAGSWYHLSGGNYDIDSTEYKKLPQHQQSWFKPVNTADDIVHVVEDHKHPRVEFISPAKPKIEVYQNPASNSDSGGRTENWGGQQRNNDNKAPTYLTYRSDLSGEPLHLGKWFHKLGVNHDITEQEWLSLAPSERIKFMRVQSLQDVSKIEQEPWVQEQNNVIGSGIFGAVGDAFKKAISAQMNAITGSLEYYAHKEENYYNKMKQKLLQSAPAPRMTQQALASPNSIFPSETPTEVLNSGEFQIVVPK